MTRQMAVEFGEIVKKSCSEKKIASKIKFMLATIYLPTNRHAMFYYSQTYLKKNKMEVFHSLSLSSSRDYLYIDLLFFLFGSEKDNVP